MTKEEAIRTIHEEAHDYPNRSAAFMADFAQVVISRIDGVPQHVNRRHILRRINLMTFCRNYCNALSDHRVSEEIDIEVKAILHEILPEGRDSEVAK